ncbi:hypothetical protein CCP1ISM_5890001 [Azospirillaceae bacterium]
MLLAEGKARTATAPGRVLGDHPDDKKPITLGTGRFGPYVKHGSVYASLPRSLAPDEITFDQALELLAAKTAKGPATRTAKGGRKPAAAKEPKAVKAKAATEAPDGTAAKTKPPAKKVKAAATKAAANDDGANSTTKAPGKSPRSRKMVTS